MARSLTRDRATGISDLLMVYLRTLPATRRLARWHGNGRCIDELGSRTRHRKNPRRTRPNVASAPRRATGRLTRTASAMRSCVAWSDKGANAFGKGVGDLASAMTWRQGRKCGKVADEVFPGPQRTIWLPLRSSSCLALAYAYQFVERPTHHQIDVRTSRAHIAWKGHSD